MILVEVFAKNYAVASILHQNISVKSLINVHE